MPKLAANLSTMFTEVPFLDRFAAAAKAGFSGVEFWFPYEHACEDVAARLTENKLTMVLFNLPPGDWDAGDRGIAAASGRAADFKAGLEQMLPYAAALKPLCVHLMAGVLPDGVDQRAAEDCFVGSLDAAASMLAPHGVTVLTEPINPRDVPGYVVSTQGQGLDLLTRTKAKNVGLQMDFYHCQIAEGDLAMRLKNNFASISHIQLAGVPDRAEPDGQNEVNFPYLLDLLDELDYQGWVGCEYFPRGKTLDGLGWCKEYLSR